MAASQGSEFIKTATNKNIATVLPNLCVIKTTEHLIKEFLHHHGKESLQKMESQMICLLNRLSKIDSLLNHLFH